MADGPSFLSTLTGSFAMPAAENPTVAMIEAAYRQGGIDARYLNCEVAPDGLGDAVRGAAAITVVNRDPSRGAVEDSFGV